MMAKRHIIHDTDDFTVTSFRNLHTRRERENAWLNNRRRGVGGSDMSAIVGASRYATPLDVWLDKTGRNGANDPGKPESWAIRKGNVLEPELRRWFHDQHPGLEMHDGTNLSLTSVRHPHMLASLDGYLWDPETESFGVLECKTANRYRASDWETGDGEPMIPVYYLVQVTHYLAVTGWQWGYVVADNSSGDPLVIRFERDEEDIDAIEKAADDFWGFVVRDEMPALRTMQDVAEAFPQPREDITEASPAQGELLREYADITRRIKALQAEQTSLKDMLCVQIGDTSGLRYGNLKATYKQTHRNGYTRTVEPWDGRMFRFTQTKED